MTDVPTRLVVRADGAIQVLDQFEKKMSDAGKATDRSSGSVANFEARMAKARAAMEAGLAMSTQTVARRSAEQRAYDNLAASVDKSYGLRIRLEREAERAAVAAANAVNMGYITQEQALTTLMALEQRHAAMMGQAAAANDNLALSYRSRAAAADEAAAASMRANAARARTAGGVNAAHTTNLLFQAQDIAMMTMMGQAPVMLALQQGMQVGGIFHQIGNGRQIVQALGGAILGLLNPLNLATIGLIALGAAGVQWFMSTFNAAEDANDALERHREMLDRALVGYDRVKSAADAALASAQRLPQGVVEVDLRMSLREQKAAEEEAQRRIEAYRESLATTLAGLRELQDVGNFGMGAGPDSEGMQQISMLQQLGASASLTRTELAKAMEASKALFETSTDPAIKALADDFYMLFAELYRVQGQIGSVDTALRNLDRDVQIRISVSEVFSGAMTDINSLYMDPRNRFDQARAELDLRARAAQDSAQSMSELTALASDYQRVRASIDAAEAEANERSSARGAKAAQKPFDQWQGSVDQFQQRIASQRLEIELLGQSSYEIERQRAAFELLNQAKAAGIPITDQINSQIDLMSVSYATVTAELERQQQQVQFLNDTYAMLGNVGLAAVNGIVDVLKDGKIEAEEFGSILGDVLRMAGQFFLNSAFGGLTSWMQNSNPLGFLFNAKGNVFNSPSLSAYSNQIYDTPQLFAFAQGAGVFAEAGPEAIMPLARTASGDLGVRVANDAGAANSNVRYGDINVSIERIEANSEAEGAAAARGFQREMKRWQDSGEGKRFVRDTMQKMGRAN